MPWAGAAGAQTFTRTMGVSAYDGATCWEQTDAALRGIRSDDHDYHDEDIAQGISNALHKGGGNTAHGNLRMGGFKLTGLAAGSAAGESVRFEQLESGVLTTRGDMLFRGASGVTRLAKGTNGQFLRIGPNDPAWVTPGSTIGFDIGQYGGVVPLLNLNCTWSAAQIFTPTLNNVVAQYLNRANPSYTPLMYFNVQNLLGGETSNSWVWFIGQDTYMAGSIASTYASGAGVTVYATSSDGRLKPKAHRRPIDDSGDLIDRLNPVYFRWSGIDGEIGKSDDFGFVAQEVYEVLPGAVTKGDDGPFVPLRMEKNEKGEMRQVGGSQVWQMQHGRLEAVLVAELKALRRRVAELEAHVAA